MQNMSSTWSPSNFMLIKKLCCHTLSILCINTVLVFNAIIFCHFLLHQQYFICSFISVAYFIIMVLSFLFFFVPWLYIITLKNEILKRVKTFILKGISHNFRWDTVCRQVACSPVRLVTSPTPGPEQDNDRGKGDELRGTVSPLADDNWKWDFFVYSTSDYMVNSRHPKMSQYIRPIHEFNKWQT